MNRVCGLFFSNRLLAGLLAVGSCAAGLAVARLALAADAAYPIPRAASVYLTQRGQNYFAQKELLKILERNQIDLSRGFLKSKSYEATADFKLGKLPRDIRGNLRQLQTALDEWLGYELGSPRFHAVARELGYEIERLELGLRIDRELTARRGGEGVVLVAELTIPKLKVRAQSLCGYDSNNPIFGTCKESTSDSGKYVDGFGVYNPWVELNDHEPLRLSLPVLVRIGEKGMLKVEVFKRDGIELSNLGHLEFANGHDRDILIPKVSIRIGSQKSSPKPHELRKALESKEREIVKIGIHHLHDYIEQELPAYLNAKLQERLSQSFDAIKDIAPPGTPLFGIKTPIKWGLRPTALGVVDDLLYVHLDGSISDDMTWVDSAPHSRTLEAPNLKGMNRSAFDFAVTLNLEVINRIIEHSYKRGNLSRPDSTASGIQYRIASLPVLTGTTDRKVRLHTSIEMERDGSFKQWVALSNPFQLEIDLELRVEPATLHSFNLVMDHVDRNTSHIPDRFIDHAKESVKDIVKKRIDSINSGYERTTTCLTDAPIELPPTLLGLPLRLLRGDFDMAGYLNLYFAYGDRE